MFFKVTTKIEKKTNQKWKPCHAVTSFKPSVTRRHRKKKKEGRAATEVGYAIGRMCKS